MAASAFHFVWPDTGMLRVRVLACFVLVMAERVINLAAPIAFKHMVEVLSTVITPAAAVVGGVAGGSSSRRSLLSMTWRELLAAVQSNKLLQYPVLHLDSIGGTRAAVGSISAADAGGEQLLVPFWMLFYPWVFVYLGAFLLRGGSGSEGLLANVRDILWIPITQVNGAHVAFSCSGFVILWLSASTDISL
jgi:hypothetical protein